MSVTASRTVTIGYTLDVVGTQELEAAVNEASPGQVSVYDLALGANTITVPPSGTVRSATIMPPSSNAVSITLKGVTGDTGVALHLTDPTSIGLAAGVASFCLTAGGAIEGLRIFWT